MTKIRIHKCSFEKIKITIKSQENISPPPPRRTALVDLQYIRSANTWCERSVTSGVTVTPDLPPVSRQARVRTLQTNFGYKFKPVKGEFEGFSLFFCKVSPSKNLRPSFYSEAQHLEMLKNTKQISRFSNQRSQKDLNSNPFFSSSFFSLRTNIWNISQSLDYLEANPLYFSSTFLLILQIEYKRFLSDWCR